MGLPVENDLLLAITSAQITAESKFGTEKEHKSRDMSRDHLP